MSQEKNRIDLKQLKEPVFELEEAFLPVNGSIYFENLSKMTESVEDYSAIDVIVQTQCMDLNRELNLFGDKQVAVKRTRLPLRKRIPVMSLRPEELFNIGKDFDKSFYAYLWEKVSLDSIRKFFLEEKEKFKPDAFINSENYFSDMNSTYSDPAELYIELNNSLDEREDEINNSYNQLRADIDRMNHHVFCTYHIQVEDQHNPSNQVEFDPKFYKIYWNRQGYGVD